MPETRCPVCNWDEGYCINSMETYICGHCGALFNWSPFGPELISHDARIRFPEYGILDVDEWKKPPMIHLDALLAKHKDNSILERLKKKVQAWID